MNTVRQNNLLRCYHLATMEERDSGMTWYRDANCEADRLAVENGIDVQQSAGIIAAVSPGLRWERNVACAERIIKGEVLDGLGVRWYDGVWKAEKILRGKAPMHVLRGNKVRAFYACILDPSNRLHVCVDGHAYAIWVGRRVTLDDVPTLNDRLYTRIAADYANVAYQVGITPCQLQAITWVTWRRLHSV